MPLRSTVDNWMGDLYLEPWKAFFREKRARGDLVRVGDVWVDAPNVVDRPFTCDPTTCSPGLRKRGQESCCAEFLVEITPGEVKNLARIFDDVSAFLKKKDPDWAKKERSLEDCLQPHADNRFQLALGKRKKRCTLSFLDDEGAIRCGIHGWALENGIDVHTVKPKLCFMFPLLVQDLQDGTWLLTVIDEENSELVAFTSHHTLPCLQGEKAYGAVEDGAVPFYEDHKSTLSHLFGARFVKALDKLAQERAAEQSAAKHAARQTSKQTSKQAAKSDLVPLSGRKRKGA